MFTRFGATVLICGLCAGVAAGCGGSSSTTNTSTPAAAQSTPAQTTTAQTTAATTTAAATTAAPTSAAATPTGATIQVTPKMLAAAQVACGDVGAATGPDKGTLEHACSQLTSGDVSGAVATYNTICRQQSTAATSPAERALLAQACPIFVLH